MNRKHEYDVFISHASKDKAKVANSLKQELERLSINCFYDSDCIAWGDKWEERIKDAISKTKMAIFIISPAFLKREWTEKELRLFFDKQDMTNQRIVFPIAYRIKIEKVIEKYPFLSSIQMYKLKNNSEQELRIVALSFKNELLMER